MLRGGSGGNTRAFRVDGCRQMWTFSMTTNDDILNPSLLWFVKVSAQYAREVLKKTSVLERRIFGQLLHALAGHMNLSAWHLQVKRRCATQYG